MARRLASLLPLFGLVWVGGCARPSSSDIAPPGAAEEPGAGELSVLAYNVYLRPRILFRDGQLARAALLPAALTGYDVLILSEVFDERAREILLAGLKAEYPYATAVFGGGGFTQSSGVVIASRWPIKRQARRAFGVCAGTDCFADKGAVYAQIEKSGRRYSLFGTHTQAWPTRRSAAVRGRQFAILREFIDAQSIPAAEPVLIGGDLNVDRLTAPAEYEAMLETLGATFAAPEEGRYTFDPEENRFCGGRVREFLDYVLFRGAHVAPKLAASAVVRPRAAAPWRRGIADLSDHFALSSRFAFE
jgi:endonuclease/exonuclease/phosphatase family metal-dependent hydrolase